MRRNAKIAALISGTALLVAACGEAPDENGEDDEAGTDGAEETEAAEGNPDFTACMVTDEGGIDDQSFNQAAADGLESAASAGAIGPDPNIVESNAAADYAPNLSNLVQEDCGIIVTVGFLLADATVTSANDNPDERYAIVDNLFGEDAGLENDNVKSLVFNTHEAAFLAGYVAAGYSETGTVGTWGGAQLPTVTIFMDGFADGVAHYNEARDEEVELIGWDKEAQDGQFVGDFSDTATALQISENMIQEGADVIMPVAGPLGAQTATAAQDAGDTAVIWVDTDGTVSAPEFTDVLLTSVMKGISVAVEDAVTTTANGEFSSEPYVGTLENGGVGLAPYHEFDDELSDELKTEVQELRDQIISGEIEVESPAAF